MKIKKNKPRQFFFGFLGGVTIGVFCVFAVSVDDFVSENLEPLPVPEERNDVSRRRNLFADVAPKLLLTKENDEVARQLSKKIRVFCWLYYRQTVHFFDNYNSTMETWGPKCTNVIIFVDTYNKSLPAVGFDHIRQVVVKSTSDIIMAYRYIYERHFLDADWFFSAEAVPFVIMENLRHFLSNKDPDVPKYYGHQMKLTQFVPGMIYADRAAGIVLSRAGLKLLATVGNTVPACNSFPHQLGIGFANCMLDLGVTCGDTRDEQGRSQFLLFPLGILLRDDALMQFEYRVDNEESNRTGMDKISTSLISVGRSNTQCYGYNFLAYHQLKVDI